MHIAELVARHALDERRPSGAVVVRPSAEPLAEALAEALPDGPAVRSWDEPGAGEPGARTVVEVIAVGHEQEQIADLSEVLGETDVAVLLFGEPPHMLPVGVVTDALTRHRLAVLDGCGTTDRLGRTVLAVSRDAERLARGYLTGTPIPDDEAGRLRQSVEWAVEGLQLRSSVQFLERRIEGQLAELLQARKEHRKLDQQLSVMEDALSVAQDALVASQRSLAAAGRESAVRPSGIRKALRRLVEDPKHGPRRIAHRLARRWRH